MKKSGSAFLTRNTKTDVVLFLCSLVFYFIYFHHIFLNINGLLSSITLDSLKNYYTFVYHIKNDVGPLHFEGLNYPYGEHVVYTDCQPLFTFIFRWFPFLQPYLIGCLHTLMFLSFIVSPLFLIRIFRILEIDEWSAFLFSLALAFLAPQFLKINAGHFALAYGCIFPLIILLLLRYIQKSSATRLFGLFVFNTILFFLHPYLGFCCSVFSFLCLMMVEAFKEEKKYSLNSCVHIFIISLLPLVLFKLFLWLSDTHVNRTTEPFGAFLMVENIDSILSPVYGPFKAVMEYFFPNRTTHYEGHTYLGFGTIVLSLLSLLLMPLIYKKIPRHKALLAVFLSSVIILFISFGVHLKILSFLHLKSGTLNQFRAVCRFAWLFYYTLPLFVIYGLYHGLKSLLTENQFKKGIVTVSILFLASSMLEAHFYFKLDESSYWKFRNFFHAEQLNAEELDNLNRLAKNGSQAIIPLPIYHGGSEMYDRLGSSNSMIPSMIYSYHSGIPILSVMLSRTSLTETENLIQVLNPYKRNKPIISLLNESNFFVINTQDPKLPDEERLIRKMKWYAQNDTLQFGFISKTKLLEKNMNTPIQELQVMPSHLTDSNSVFFITSEKRKPFQEALMKDYELITSIDSNHFKSGKYIVSLHFHYTKNTYQALACALIVTQTNQEGSVWQYTLPIRYLSGFYNGYAVFENKIELDSKNKYEFILKGDLPEAYHISHFLLRPEEMDTRYLIPAKDTLYNNYSTW